MAVTFQECVERLLSGEKLAWDAYSSNAAGEIMLDTPSARRLFDFLIGQNQEAVAKGDESLFPGLISSWDNEDRDPKDTLVAVGAIAGISGFRLAEIKTEGFGGLNTYGGPAFVLDVDRQSWCLEGQNGSGKTSLASSIIWGLTGRRIVEHSGPMLDEGTREPVLDKDGDQIGTWPPLASYPTHRGELTQDVRVRVKLTFRNAGGEEAQVERIIFSKADGTTETEQKVVDPRLLSAPQLLDSGILMPSRMANINFGEKSQSLYEAVKALTGLDQLGSIGDGAAAFNHGAKKFLKYAKDKNIAQIEALYAQDFAKADEQAKVVDVDLSSIAVIDSAQVIEDLEKLIETLSKVAENHAKTLKAVVDNRIDVSLPEGRKQVSEAVGVAKDGAKKASESVDAFIILKELYKAKEGGDLTNLPDGIAEAEQNLGTAIAWHTKQQVDLKLRLKALAAQWYEEPGTPNDLANCPLCESKLHTPEQKKLQEELQELKAAGEKAERQLDDVCRKIRESLFEALPENLRPHIDALSELEPKSNIVGIAAQLFTEMPPFSDILTGTGEIMKGVIPIKAEGLPSFEPAAVELTLDATMPENAADVRVLILQLQNVFELADWWEEQRSLFVDFWKAIVGTVPEGENPDNDTVLGQIVIVEDALATSQPYDSVLALLHKLLELTTSWHTIITEQRKREAIATALAPLKSLRAFVDAEAARSISDLSEGMKEFLERIHLKERLEFSDAGLKKKQVHVHGSLVEDMKFDALPIANTSWLKAILWAFIFALRDKAVEVYGGNPFPLILLDDPQVTFDPRNKRKWAQELARIASLGEADAYGAQLFLTTHERQFFTYVTEYQPFGGLQGLVAAADAYSKTTTIVSGNILERFYEDAEANNDDAKGREFIRQTRIYAEKLLKYMLRGEGEDIAESNIDRMRRHLNKLRDETHTAPFTRPVFGELLKAFSGGQRCIRLINDASHDDDETIGVAEAKDLYEFWNKTLKKRIHKAFHAFAAFEAYHGDPRIFDYPANVVALPTGLSDEVRKAELFQTGAAAAAATNGRVGDGELRIEEWEKAETVALHDHEVYRLTANTLEPVATIGNLIIVSNYAKVDGKRKHLVAAAVGDRLLARRIQVGELHPDLALLTAQALNPSDLAAPEIVPLSSLEMKKVVGTLYTTNVGNEVSANEFEVIENPDEFLSILDQARLFRVQGQSAEPIVLNDQYLIVGFPIDDPAKWGEFEGRLVIAVDADGGSYFKRMCYPRAGLYIMESLNPDGTTPAVLLSDDGREGTPQLAQVLPVLGVLFDLPEQ